MFTDLWQMIRAARANTVNLGVPRNVYFKMEDEVFVVSSVAQMESPVHPLPSQSELATAVSEQRLSRSSAEGIHGVHLRGRDERNETLWHGGTGSMYIGRNGTPLRWVGGDIATSIPLPDDIVSAAMASSSPKSVRDSVDLTGDRPKRMLWLWANSAVGTLPIEERTVQANGASGDGRGAAEAHPQYILRRNISTFINNAMSTMEYSLAQGLYCVLCVVGHTNTRRWGQ